MSRVHGYIESVVGLSLSGPHTSGIFVGLQETPGPVVSDTEEEVRFPVLIVSSPVSYIPRYMKKKKTTEELCEKKN